MDIAKLCKHEETFNLQIENIGDHSNYDEEDAVDVLHKRLQNLNTNYVDVFDEDLYVEGEPFEKVASKMFDLLPNGKIKKRVIRQGSGENPSSFDTVSIHYNGYIEFEKQPFDSTYSRNRPLKFMLNSGKVLPGLDFAVQSMTLNEKSQFLIHSDYAYGKSTLIGRVPADATVLFEVEVCEVVKSGGAVTFEQLPEHDRTFPEIYDYCIALNERGKTFFKEHKLSNAIKDFNTAACELVKVESLREKDDLIKHKELLLKLYTNLLICYTKNEEYKKGCVNAEKIHKLTHNGETIKIPAKVHYNYARCLRGLGDLDNAKHSLAKAYKMEPKNIDITKELINLENERHKHKNIQKCLSKALIDQ